MKNKRDLMTKLSILGGIFGYLCLSQVRIEIRLLFIVFVLIAGTIYVLQGKKNNYSKVSIRMSTLTLALGIVLFMNELITYMYPEFLKFQAYIMAMIFCIIITMLIISAVNYIKIANKGGKIFTIVLIAFILLCITFVIIGIILKKYGIIPE